MLSTRRPFGPFGFGMGRLSRLYAALISKMTVGLLAKLETGRRSLLRLFPAFPNALWTLRTPPNGARPGSSAPEICRPSWTFLYNRRLLGAISFVWLSFLIQVRHFCTL